MTAALDGVGFLETELLKGCFGLVIGLVNPNLWAENKHSDIYN